MIDVKSENIRSYKFIRQRKIKASMYTKTIHTKYTYRLAKCS